MTRLLLPLLCIIFISGCTREKLDEKGFQVTELPEENSSTNESLSKDSLKLNTRPGSILLTGLPNIRLSTIYKINTNKRENTEFIGSDRFHNTYSEEDNDKTNNWNGHLLPGFEALYGYNLVNISLYDLKEARQRVLFDQPVLIRTVYYPTFLLDTLNSQPVQRQYIMISAFTDDTNKDRFITSRDLRRFYLFDIISGQKKSLIPENYSVYKSDYDQANDLMYVFAVLDSNKNGSVDNQEPSHIFWIDLKDPHKTGRIY